MLKFKKFFPLTCHPANSITLQQCFMSSNKFDPVVFDIFMGDKYQHDLYDKISKLLGKSYLSPIKENQKEFQLIRTGKIYGSGRGLISLPTKSSQQQKPLWVHYLIGTGEHHTFLSKEVLKALKCDETQNKFGVYINTHSIPVRLSSLQFEKINILGMDYLGNRQKLEYIMKQGKVIITDKQKK